MLPVFVSENTYADELNTDLDSQEKVEIERLVDQGADCSGFTMVIHKIFGITINRKSINQAKNGVAVSRSDLKPGDICVYSYGGSGHVTMYIGNSRVVQESNPKDGCTISSLSSATETLLGYRRCWK